MLIIIAILLIALWLLGIMASFTLGGLIHLLPLMTFIVVQMQMDRRKRITY